MQKKYKILTTLFMLSLLMLGYGIAYSMFHSNTTLSSTEQDIASLIFNAESLDEFQLSLTDLKPGDAKEYEFSVSNNYMGKLSDVSLNYQVTMKTYHLIPLIIELYRLNDGVEELILTCDETYVRNTQNELVCTTPTQEMGYAAEKLDNYKIKVKFPIEYNSAVYSDLADYVSIGIKSWQKIED